MHKPKVILAILDGWGYSTTHKGNAIWKAKTPTFDYFWDNYSHILLSAFGESVGLPWGSIGSSEVGHTSIGSGRLIHQELSLIDKEVASGDFFRNKILSDYISKAKRSKKPIHLVGLTSKGGVHSELRHLYALFKLFKLARFKQDIFIHAITDGRDTSPESALQYLDDIQSSIRKNRINAKIATITGRYYAMDRDSHWERTKSAYEIFTKKEGHISPSYKEAILKSYEDKIFDEFIKPTKIDLSASFPKGFLKFFKKGTPPVSANISDGDNIIFFNIRPDRMRQITEMFLFPKKEIGTEPVKDANILTLTTYDEFLPVVVPYPAQIISDPLAKVLSDHGVHQGHFAETEKYAHVTYFFNGGNSMPNKNESWNLVSSPNVATYDLEPEMSAKEITDKVFEVVEREKLDFVLINYANADMVGHTGVFEKVVEAVEVIDKELKRLSEFLPESTLMITADHGNAECMFHSETGEVDKKHTVNPIPFIMVNDKYKIKKSNNISAHGAVVGILADIAPTILELFSIEKPNDMNGISLINSLKS